IESTIFVVPLGTPVGPSEIVVVANGIPSSPVPLNVDTFHLNIPIFEEAIYLRLIGSLADGPLWVLGPHGPIPIGPWGPKVAREAELAREQVVSGLRALRRLGSDIARERQQVASAAPLAPHEDDEVA